MVSNKPMQTNFKRAEIIPARAVKEVNRTDTVTPPLGGQNATLHQRQARAGQMPERLLGNTTRHNGEYDGQNLVNKVMLAGRLGRDAEVRQTKGGRTVANFSVGVEESYKDRLGEWQKKTAWHRVQVWGEVAETVSADLRKGARVYIEGTLIVRNWIDKQNKKHTTTEIVASNVGFLSMAPEDQSRGAWDFAEEHGTELQ